ncbi:MAG: hypothetical protein K9L75_03400 [Spirochaetia bacterium]|nr:hypothetical protein [Spirochaetia bacterium]
MAEVTQKERFLTAMKNGKPDRVPCVPDISNYIPCRKTGKPYWDIYFNEDPPLWRAYLDAAEFFGIEAWIASCAEIPLIHKERRYKKDDLLSGKSNLGVEVEDAEEHVVISRKQRYLPEKHAMVQHIDYDTPDGSLSEELICFEAEPPTHLHRIMKDVESDWPAFRWLLQPPSDIDHKKIDRIRNACREKDQAFGLSIGYPGFQYWEGFVTGSIQTLTYLYYDKPELLEEWHELHLAAGTRAMELYLAEQPDYVLFGGSGTLTMASPELVKRFVLPSLKLWSSMAKEAGTATMLHSCGKSRLLVDLLADETDIECINPLEIAPMGDVDLREVKLARGADIALMGNLHTTSVMLYGTPGDVYRTSVQAIQDAGENGGFILSTGDQCPRETPDENLFAMVKAVKEHGFYS